MRRFVGKRILITGATSGIGLAGARRIVEEGGAVAITGVMRERLREVQWELPQESLVLHNDSGDPAAADALAREIALWGKLDGLWLNAGFAATRVTEEIDAPLFDTLMNTNARGPALQLGRLSPLLNDGGSVVATGAVAADDAAPATSVHEATKSATGSLVRSWASALAPRRIRVNAMIPGPIASRLRDFSSEGERDEFEKSIVRQVALGRVGTAEEAAAVALFLLSDDASFVTGSQYAVDGGMMMM
jgi:NAD(P)-dependent dehydrogenase (short-subunit alcohol dehydrogenase family)